jgi:hypothetical protein
MGKGGERGRIKGGKLQAAYPKPWDQCLACAGFRTRRARTLSTRRCGRIRSLLSFDLKHTFRFHFLSTLTKKRGRGANSLSSILPGAIS